MVVNQLQAALRAMVQRGYRYDKTTGIFYGLTGKPLKLTMSGTQRYPSIAVATPDLVRTTHAIPAHRAAGYYLWGDEIFKEGVQVRHKNGLFDLRECSLTLGTRMENMSDIPPEVRSRAAKAGRASQLSKHAKSSITQSQVDFIKNTARRDARGFLLPGELKRLSQNTGIRETTISGVLRGITFKPKGT